MKVENAAGDVIESWVDSPATRVVDEQVAYMISNILSDDSVRWYRNNYGYVVPGVWTATKTGTTTTTNSSVVKDSLLETYSTALSTFVWNGNHDGSGLIGTDGSTVTRMAGGTFMERVHKEVYGPDGKWHEGDQPIRPSGIQTLTVNGKTDIWPSWFNAAKNSGIAKETMTFNRYTHLLATDCTPEAYKIAIEVTKVTDPMTGKEVYSVPEPYNREATDTCNYVPPQVAISTSGVDILATIIKGTYDIASYSLYINGEEKTGVSIGANGKIIGYTLTGQESSVKLVVRDSSGYEAVSELTLVPTRN